MLIPSLARAARMTAPIRISSIPPRGLDGRRHPAKPIMRITPARSRKKGQNCASHEATEPLLLMPTNRRPAAISINPIDSQNVPDTRFEANPLLPHEVGTVRYVAPAIRRPALAAALGKIDNRRRLRIVGAASAVRAFQIRNNEITAEENQRDRRELEK